VTAGLVLDYAPLDDRLRPPSRTVWLAAALGALAIHAAGAVFVFQYLQRDAADELGAPGILIDVDLTSPRRDPTDLPVGPDAEASAPSPAVVEQKTVVEETDLPKAIPTDADDPDSAVTPDDVKKPDDKDPKITAVQATPSNAAAAAEATAVPSVENAASSPRSAAPSLGTGESSLRDRVTWEKELAAHFDKYKRYPGERAMQAAQVIVNFVLDRAGHVLSSRVVKGSGDAAFDAAALAMLQRADPVPSPPSEVADQGLSFTLPVIFHVTQPK
jgi:periplasmic protein TonB